jgi:hypothetical protein
LERLRKYPGSSFLGVSSDSPVPWNFHECLISHLTDLCHKWSAPLHSMSARKDTHDLGFIVQPALRRDWELFGQQKSLNSLLAAAESLASRYDERVGAIRSWDGFVNAHHNITNMENDFLVIIDSMCSKSYLYIAHIGTNSFRPRSPLLCWQLHAIVPSHFYRFYTRYHPSFHTSPQGKRAK